VKRLGLFALAVSLPVAVLSAAQAGTAAGPPPPPKAVNGHAVAVVARGIPTPTTFAFGGGHVFVAAFGDEENPKVKGGVFVLRGSRPVKLAGSPDHVFGLAYQVRTGTLFVSAGPQILAWSGWNGTRFTRSRVVVTAPQGFTGFNGIALGPAENLYAGVSLGDRKQDDYSAGDTPWANDVVTVNAVTGQIAFHSTGLRQPWQPVFVPGRSGPLVSDLGQENLGKKHPIDRIVEIAPGANYGFPSCPARPATCFRYTKPFAVFPAHASPMGLAPLGGTLYVALFGGTGKGPEVVAAPLAGGSYRPVLVGFVAPVVALGVHGGRIWAGDLTGSIYSFVP
jgi:glucose/arabinose dehydrogenase